MSGLEDKLAAASLEPAAEPKKKPSLFGKKKKKSFATKLTQSALLKNKPQNQKPYNNRRPSGPRTTRRPRGAAPTSPRRTTARSRRYLLRYMLPETSGRRSSAQRARAPSPMLYEKY